MIPLVERGLTKDALAGDADANEASNASPNACVWGHRSFAGHQWHGDTCQVVHTRPNQTVNPETMQGLPGRIRMSRPLRFQNGRKLRCRSLSIAGMPSSPGLGTAGGRLNRCNQLHTATYRLRRSRKRPTAWRSVDAVDRKRDVPERQFKARL